MNHYLEIQISYIRCRKLQWECFVYPQMPDQEKGVLAASIVLSDPRSHLKKSHEIQARSLKCDATYVHDSETDFCHGLLKP